LLQIIFGAKGTGKTKRILELANRIAAECKGSTVFIDDDNNYMYDLDYSIRFINASEYGINGVERFYGFLCGLAASDYDLEYVFVDGFASLVSEDMAAVEETVSRLQHYTELHKIHLVIAVSSSTELPETLKGYVI